MQLKNVVKNAHLISIDSRIIKKGDIFIAIKGRRFDGHDFAEEAFKKGAKFAIVSREPKKLRSNYKKHLIIVKDTVKTLGDIAASHRAKFNIPVIAVTGTNGKTTAKDMVAHVLSSRYNVLKNETSKNNYIGLPLTLLKLERKHDVAVLEMGMSRFGEIDRLSKIAKPRIGVITNIGPAHMEFLGTLKNIFIAKAELLKRLREKGLAILNKDDRYLRSIKNLKCRKIYFGIDRRCNFQATKLLYRGNKWSFEVDEKQNFEFSLFGRHNIYNALIAIAVAREFDIDFSTIAEKIRSYRQNSPMRLGFKNIRGIGILDDSYNSNPLSMECAIDTLARYVTRGKKIVVSGDMLELGKKAKTMHEAIGRMLASSPIDVLITHGRLSVFMNKEAKRKGMGELYHAPSHSDAAGFLRKIARPNDVVLVKGSRAMAMDKIIEEFKKGYQGAKS